jgi:hypothetical protein
MVDLGERQWSRNFRACRNCGGTKRRHAAQGYCGACYRLARKLNTISRWDGSNPHSLNGFPTAIGLSDQLLSKMECIKSECCKQIAERLDQTRILEQKLSSPIYGIDIEHQLKRIARLFKISKSRNSDHLYHGIADFVDWKFDLEQRSILYKLLRKIEDQTPDPGINWNRVWGKCL